METTDSTVVGRLICCNDFVGNISLAMLFNLPAGTLADAVGIDSRPTIIDGLKAELPTPSVRYFL